MSEPPKQIDGAIVIEWAWSGSDPFGYLLTDAGEVAAKVFGLAICQYPNDDKFYRFSCDDSWESEQDSDYSSISDAKQQLPKQYQLVDVNWLKD